MTAGVEGKRGSLGRDVQEVSAFKYEARRIDEACIVCFVPSCETPIKDGCSEIKVNRERGTVEPAGEIVASRIDDNGITYSADGKGAVSHFSAQHRLVVQLGQQSEDVQGVIDLLESNELKVLLDDRDPNRVRVYLGACKAHHPMLRSFETEFKAEGSMISQPTLKTILKLTSS